MKAQLVVATLLTFCWVNNVAMAQVATRTFDKPTQHLVVPLFQSTAIRLETPVARVSVGSPDIADMLILRATQLYVIGKDLGTTNVLLWDRNDNLIDSISVEVTHDLESLKLKLHELLPDEPIDVYSAQRSLVLRGTVSSVSAMGAALSVARGYLAEVQTAVDATEFEQSGGFAGEVINLLQVGGGQQVMLEVKIAEINRDELKRLDVQFNAIGDQGNWTLGGVNGGAVLPRGEFFPLPQVIQQSGLFGQFLSNSFEFNTAIDAAREKGLAKILAEPTLTTLTGQEAEFLSGGEFPIPVPNGDNGITIEFKDFGVGLRFLPVVLGNGKINFRLNVSVSQIVNQNTLGLSDDNSTASFIVPSLTRRSAAVTLELNDGQTMGIAGLINEETREIITKFPGLGSVPILGALFRSQEFIKNESELVILVTPRLAKPLDGSQISLPTDGFVEPSDFEFYLLGKTEGRARRNTVVNTPSGAGGVEENFGHRVE
jgi:pilus assembly protein CpaC